MIPAGLDDAPRPARRPRGRRGEQATADHQAQIHRAFTYRQKDARSADDFERLAEELERRLAEGPDFMGYRRKSEFKDAPRHNLNRTDLHRLRFAFNSMARGTWLVRKKGKHRGAISRTCRDVFGAFIFLAEKFERVFPSLERLASLAQCCKQSVVLALRTLETLGFLTRHRRLRMVEGLLGRKAEQATNAYEIHLPHARIGAVGLLMFPTKSESNSCAAIGTESLSSLVVHPESWGSPGITQCDAHGEPPSAAHF